MYQFSDSDSVDSDDGVRYKTESIRNKKPIGKNAERNRERETSRREKRRSRSRSRNRYETDRDRRKSKGKRKKDYSPEDKSNRKSSRHKYKDSDRSNDKKYKVDKTSNNEKELVLKQKDEKLNKDFSLVTESSDKCSPFGLGLPKNEGHGNDKEVNLNLDKKEASIQSTEDDTTQHLSFGPTLPPKENTEEHSQKEDTFGPQLPPHLIKKPGEENNIIGPVLPSHFITVSSLDDDNSNVDASSIGNNKESGNVVGPALPPHMLTKSEENTIGPALPLHLQQQESSQHTLPNEEKANIDEEDIYGPLPIGAQYTKAHIELEERALKMKMDQLESSDSKQPVREEWMLTLPEAKAAHFGLGPRQFRAKAGPDLSDRSSWTDTPEDKAKKKEGKVEPVIDLKKEAEQKHIQNRNVEQEKIAKEHKTEKGSLLEIHQKKLKKQKKSESGPSERRPFSREIDLQVNRFDEAQKKAVLKKAQLLDTRFSSGESKFL